MQSSLSLRQDGETEERLAIIYSLVMDRHQFKEHERKSAIVDADGQVGSSRFGVKNPRWLVTAAAVKSGVVFARLSIVPGQQHRLAMQFS